ncbi:MAG: OmpH family outer membrane protein [Tannerella sp.]|jgi:outer membrane protein|nr:OmpH family outer membrane protein [Tannerella sp.]
MKKIILSILMFIPLGIIAQETKIAVIDKQTVLLAMPEMSTYESGMAKVQTEYQTVFKELQDDYNRKYADLVNQGDSLSDNIKMLRMQEIQDLKTRMDNYYTTAQEGIQKEQQKLIAPILEKLDKAIKDVGAENGYIYILNDNPEIVLFKGKGAIDITDKVKAKLGIK